jgi:hypothetical protein
MKEEDDISLYLDVKLFVKAFPLERVQIRKPKRARNIFEILQTERGPKKEQPN